jgi:beta-lactamase regulating signal transducer with metallopeptidase domain/protein involved in polysaccharide export with SLBB domain
MNPHALGDVFPAVAILSWRASWLILAVLGLRFALRRRLPAQVWFLAWLVIAIRLLLPFSVPAAWSPFALLAYAPGVAPASVRDAVVTPAPENAVASVPMALPGENAAARISAGVLPDLPVTTAGAPVATLASHGSNGEWLFVIWLGGVAALLLGRLIAGARFARALRQAPADRDPRLRRILALETTARIRCVETAAIDAPALFGVFRPRLLFPPGLTSQLSDDELRLVVRHELGHWRRRDLLAQALLHAAAMVHWFNPLAWLAARLARTDCELACDEFVLRREGAEGASAYGATLLKVLGVTRPTHRRPIAVVGILEGREQLTQRVHSIAGYRRTGFAGLALGLALIVSLATVALTREARAQTLAESARPANGGSADSPATAPALKTRSAAPARAAASVATISTDEAQRALEPQRQRVEQLASDLQAYKEQHNLVSLDQSRDMVNDALKVANAEVTRSSLALNAAEARLAQIAEYRKQNADLTSLPCIASYPLVASLQQRLAAKHIEIAALNERYKDRHPQVIEATRELAEVEKELQRAVDSGCRQVQADAEMARRNYDAARQELARREAQALDLERRAVDFTNKQRALSEEEQSLQTSVARAAERRFEMMGGPAAAIAAAKAAEDFTVSVVGAVNNQSGVTFAGRDKPMVLDAIARAGGFAPNANRGAVRLIRSAPDERRSLVLTEEMLMSGTGDAAALQRGDVVIVPELPAPAPRFATILGMVNSPGRVALPEEGRPKMTLMELLARAGGQGRLANLKQVRVSRFDPKTRSNKSFTVDLDAFVRGTVPPDGDWSILEVESGDVVSVPERIL